jgi:hypothetical protein
MMNERARRTAAVVSALLTLCLGLPAPDAPAQSEPVLTVHIDFDAWNAGYPDSRLAACWDSPVVQQWRSTSLQQLMGLAQAQSGVDMQAVFDHLTGEAALAVTLAPPPMEGMPPMPQAALAIRQPGQIDSLLALITGNLGSAEQEMVQQWMLRQGDVLAFGNDPALSAHLISALEQGAEGLGLETPPGSFLAGRLDVSRILQGADPYMEPEAKSVLQDLGLGNLTALTFNSGFEGTGLAGDCVIDFDGPRTGMMSFIGPDRAFGVLGLLPPNAMSAAAVNIAPPVEIYDWIAALVKSHGGPAAAQEFDEGEQGFQTTTGLAPRQVMSAFGQEHALVFGGMTGMSMDIALISEVRDRATVEQLIANLIQSLNETMTAQGMMAISPVPMTVGDITYTSLMVPGMPFQLCHVFIGDHLVVATSQNQMTAICEAVGSGQSLTGSSAYAEVAAQMRSPAALFSFQNNRQSAQSISQALLPIMALAGQQMPPEAFQLMSQLPALAEHMGSKGSTLSASPTRLSIHSYQSSGAEAIIAAMVLTTAAQAGIQAQLQQAQQEPMVLQPEEVTSTGQPGTVLIYPEPLVAGRQVSVRYDPAGGPIQTAATVYIHIGHDGWVEGTITDLPMSRDPASGHWTITLTMPTDRSQLDFVFHDGQEGWDNNDGQDWRYPITEQTQGVTL